MLPGHPQHFSWKVPSRLLWSMADVLPLRLQRRSALRKPAWRRALQGHTDYIRGEKLGGKWMFRGCGQGRISLTRLLEDWRMGRILRCYLWRLQVFLGQFFWNLLCGLADRSSLLFRLVQKALIMPLEIAEPAECVILVLALSFLLCLQAESF